MSTLTIKAKKVFHEGRVCRGLWEVVKNGKRFEIATREDGYKGWAVSVFNGDDSELIAFEDTKREGLWAVQEWLNAEEM